MHLDQEKIQRLLHRELSQEEARAVQQHLDSCTACATAATRAREEEEEVFTLLEALDHAPPLPVLDDIVRQVRPRRPHLGRWAAGILLGLGVASAAYAAPGSPFPEILSRFFTGGRAPSEPGTTTSGVAVLPGADLTIRISSHQSTGRVLIRLTGEEEVVVRAEGGTPGFTSGDEELVVMNEGGGTDLEILVPRDAPRVTVLIAGELAFSLVGGAITSWVEPMDDGRYSIPLQPTGR